MTTTTTAASEVIATTAAAVAKAPSKKSQAQVIFTAKLAEKAQGLYGSNKEFRAAVLGAIETGLGVSRASASTMFNSFKKESEAAGLVVLGRDPKKAKAPSTGKRGRPAGSVNKKAEVTAETTATTEVAPAATV
jgi:hypothetical protein